MKNLPVIEHALEQILSYSPVESETKKFKHVINIDIGSNSAIFLFASYVFESSNSSWIFNNKICEVSEVTGLGVGLAESGYLNKAGKEFAINLFKQFFWLTQKIKENFKNLNVLTTASGTAIFRDSHDATSFRLQCEDILQVPLHILSGSEEAFYTLKGVLLDIELFAKICKSTKCNSTALSDLKSTYRTVDRLLLVDMGGASTEFTWIKKEDLLNFPNYSLRDFQENCPSLSLKLGSAALTTFSEDQAPQYIQNVFDQMHIDLQNSIPSSNNFHFFDIQSIVLIAGTFCSMAQIYKNIPTFHDETIHGLTVSFQDFEKFIENHLDLKSEDWISRFPSLEKRAKTLPKGFLITSYLLKRFPCHQILFSARGLRHGLPYLHHLNLIGNL